MILITHRSSGPNESAINYPLITLVLALWTLLISTNTSAQTFFSDNTQKPSGYFNNEGIRHEKIDPSKQAPVVHYSKKHKLIADFFNSDLDQLATHSEWESKSVLRIGVVRRSFNQKEYTVHACKVISASGLADQKVTIRMIHLPSLIAKHKLTILAEQQCGQV